MDAPREYSEFPCVEAQFNPIYYKTSDNSDLIVDVGGTPAERAHKDYPMNIVDAIRCGPGRSWITWIVLRIIAKLFGSKSATNQLVVPYKLRAEADKLDIIFSSSASISKKYYSDLVLMALNIILMPDLINIIVDYYTTPTIKSITIDALSAAGDIPYRRIVSLSKQSATDSFGFCEIDCTTVLTGQPLAFFIASEPMEILQNMVINRDIRTVSFRNSDSRNIPFVFHAASAYAN